MMKRISGVAVTATLLGCLALSLMLLVPGSRVQAAEPIKIGIVLSMTGGGGFLGVAEQKAITAPVEEINRQGGLLGRQIELYYEDDRSDPTTATVAATKLIRETKVCAIIGPSTAEACMAVAPICEREQIPQLPMAPLTLQLKKWIFLVPVTDAVLADKMVLFTVKTLGARKLALFNDSGRYGRSGADGVKAAAAKYGATIVIQEECEQLDTNMISQLTKIRAANPEAIMLFTPAPAAAIIAKNYQQLGMQKIPVVTGGGVPSKQFPSLAGKIVEDGRWIPFDPMDLYAEQLPPNDPFRKDLYDPLFKAIKKKYGENTPWDGFFRNGYDNIAILIEALKIAKTDDRAAIRDALEKVRYKGFLGTFAYSPTDHDGTTGDTFVPILIKDGKYWPYKK
ncbi:MAG: ABC transporter substrate-binding protein [Syntrophorhabdales bacterium]|jgi:branched-chain amino acid transport system substrate-binding protein